MSAFLWRLDIGKDLSPEGSGPLPFESKDGVLSECIERAWTRSLPLASC
jgi:hypothetical protein